MANKLSLLSLSLSLLFLFHGCLARHSSQSQQSQNACQINRLDAIKPATRIKSEAGVTEWWNPSSEQLQCAGVAVMRHTVEPNGLVLPSFTSAPQLVYVVQGRGIQGTIISGCPETYQDSQQSQSNRFQDRHQKIRRLREGDVIAVPVGVVHWCYNDGNEPLVTVNLLDTGSNANQLDNNPRRFHLAGNPEEEQRKLRKLQQQQQQGSSSESEDEDEEEDEDNRKSRGQHQQESSGGNLVSNLDDEMLAEILNVDMKIIKKIQNVDKKRGTIVKVKNELQVIQPPRMEQEEREERQQERQRQQRGGRRGQYDDNGLEETFCSMRIKENIADPERADIFNPHAGRISTLNSFNLPILRYIGLSAERGVLYNNAGLMPQWYMNAHRVCYMLRGSARVQVVNQNGDQLFDDEIEKGQILTVPQNHAFIKRAGSEGAEWVCFNTNDNAMSTPLAGRLSVMRALPEEVVANSFQISREEARRLKFSNPNNVFFTSSSSQRRAEA